MENVTAASVGAVEVEAPDLVEPLETLRLANVLAGLGIELRNIEARLVDPALGTSGVWYPCIAFPSTGEAAAFLPELARIIDSAMSPRQRRRFHVVALSRDRGPGGLIYFPSLAAVDRRRRT